jgi:hypothetical protein
MFEIEPLVLPRKKVRLLETVISVTTLRNSLEDKPDRVEEEELKLPVGGVSDGSSSNSSGTSSNESSSGDSSDGSSDSSDGSSDVSSDDSSDGSSDVSSDDGSSDDSSSSSGGITCECFITLTIYAYYCVDSTPTTFYVQWEASVNFANCDCSGSNCVGLWSNQIGVANTNGNSGSTTIPGNPGNAFTFTTTFAVPDGGVTCTTSQSITPTFEPGNPNC